MTIQSVRAERPGSGQASTGMRIETRMLGERWRVGAPSGQLVTRDNAVLDLGGNGEPVRFERWPAKGYGQELGMGDSNISSGVNSRKEIVRMSRQKGRRRPRLPPVGSLREPCFTCPGHTTMMANQTCKSQGLRSNRAAFFFSKVLFQHDDTSLSHASECHHGIRASLRVFTYNTSSSSAQGRNEFIPSGSRHGNRRSRVPAAVDYCEEAFPWLRLSRTLSFSKDTPLRPFRERILAK